MLKCTALTMPPCLTVDKVACSVVPPHSLHILNWVWYIRCLLTQNKHSLYLIFSISGSLYWGFTLIICCSWHSLIRYLILLPGWAKGRNEAGWWKEKGNQRRVRKLRSFWQTAKGSWHEWVNDKKKFLQFVVCLPVMSPRDFSDFYLFSMYIQD